MSSRKDSTPESVSAHKCESCSCEFRASTLNLERKSVRQKLCVSCTRARLRNDAVCSTFLAKVWKKFKTDLTVISYTDNNTVAVFQCTCGKQFKATPTSIIRKSKKSTLDCGSCGSSDVSAKPKVKVGDRTLRLLPIENEAINALIAQKKFKASKFKDTSKVDPLIVKSGKRQSFYVPSFKYGSAMVSVFSADTFARDWSSNVAIAKKCRSKFDAHKVVVVGKTLTVLPAEWFKDKVETLKLLSGTQTPTEITVLSLDPGTANHGWAVLKIRAPFEPQVIAHGLISNTITQMKGNMAVQALAYTSEIQSIIEQYGCTHLAAERYMTRGIKGTTIECVNAMIGCLIALSWPHCGDVIVDKMVMPASQWKNEWNRHSSLDDFYPKVNCVAHQVDSIGIGLYAGAVWMGQKPFETIKKLERKLAPNINKTNTEPHKKR